jgi:hypothetical protein
LPPHQTPPSKTLDSHWRADSPRRCVASLFLNTIAPERSLHHDYDFNDSTQVS